MLYVGPSYEPISLVPFTAVPFPIGVEGAMNLVSKSSIFNSENNKDDFFSTNLNKNITLENFQEKGESFVISDSDKSNLKQPELLSVIIN